MYKYLISWTIIFLGFCMLISHMNSLDEGTSENSTASSTFNQEVSESIDNNLDLNSPKPETGETKEISQEINASGNVIHPESQLKIETAYGMITVKSATMQDDKLCVSIEVFNQSNEVLDFLSLLYIDVFAEDWLTRINNTSNYEITLNPGGIHEYITYWEVNTKPDYIRLHLGDLVGKTEYIKVVNVNE